MNRSVAESEPACAGCTRRSAAPGDSAPRHPSSGCRSPCANHRPRRRRRRRWSSRSCHSSCCRRRLCQETLCNPTKDSEHKRVCKPGTSALPLDVVFRLLLDQPNAFKHVGDVVDAPLLHAQLRRLREHATPHVCWTRQRNSVKALTAVLRSSTPSSASCSRTTNFLVSRPSWRRHISFGKSDRREPSCRSDRKSLCRLRASLQEPASAET